MTLLNQQAYEHILDLIITNQLEEQTIYSETKLSKKLGISRTPLRDAIQRLAQEGYIDIIPSKGFALHQLTKKDVTETFQVRSALECYCTLQITKKHTSPEAQALFNDLSEILEHLKEIKETTHDLKEFIDYDFQFHEKIIRYVNNEQFFSLFVTYSYRMKRFAQLSLSHERRMEDTYDEHMAILSTMKNGDVNNILEVTLRHMDNPYEINMGDVP